MSKLTSTKSGVPRTKPGAPNPIRGVHNTGVIHDATLIFLEHGAAAAVKHLGGSLRAKLLLPKVFARAKYIDRRVKRLGLDTQEEAA